MSKHSITFLRSDQAATKLRRVAPTDIKTARIVFVGDGYQLHARLNGSTDHWVMTSPGGIANTFGDLPGLRKFVSVVLGRPRTPIAYQAAHLS